MENQNRFSFLNIKLSETLGKKAFETSVHRKSTLSGAFTNFKSFTPITCKTGFLSLFFNMLFLWKVSQGNCQEKLPRRIRR